MTDENKIAEELNGIMYALRSLGTGNAATQLGAIEYLGKSTADGFQYVADAIRGASNSDAISEAGTDIRDGLSNVAHELEELARAAYEIAHALNRIAETGKR